MVLIILGLLLGCAGLGLWYLDSQRAKSPRTATERGQQNSDAHPSQSLVVGGVEVHPVALDSDEQLPPQPVSAQPVGVALGEEEIEVAADVESLAPPPTATSDAPVRDEERNPATGEFPVIDEKMLAAHAAANGAAEVQDETEEDTDAAEDAASDTPEDTPNTTEAADQPEPVAKPAPAAGARSRLEGLRSPGLGLFHSPRRERKQWAQQHGFEYTKSDALLADEWTRNAAASGAAARDVISGLVHGYEVHFADLAGTEIMALRRSQASDVVVELQQPQENAQSPQEDLLDQGLFAESALLTVGTYGSFTVLSDEPAVASRLIDARFQDAVAKLTPAVQRLWVETEWLLVEWAEDATLADWEANMDICAHLADIFRVLPPAATRQAPATLRKTQMDPSRNLPRYFPEPATPKTETLDSLPQVDRENAPVALPTRGTALRKGEVELNALGNDEVDAIGQGNSGMDSHFGTRVLRSSAGSSIFDDIAQELGTDPFAESFSSLEELLAEESRRFQEEQKDTDGKDPDTRS